VNEIANKRFRLGTKSAFNTPLRAEKVGNNRIAASLHPLEQQRGSSLVYDTPVNLGHFKIGIYFGFDGNDVVLSVEQIEKCAEVRMHQVLSRVRFSNRARATSSGGCFLAQTFFDFVAGYLRCFSHGRLQRFPVEFD